MNVNCVIPVVKVDEIDGRYGEAAAPGELEHPKEVRKHG